ncbi:TOBE domain protein [compost metagenome]
MQQGSPELLYHQPSSAYVAGLLGEYSLLDPADPLVQQLIPLRPDGGQWLLRPEQVFLSTDAGHGIAGQVVQQSFRGSHFLTTVQAGRQRILAASRDASLQPGAAVFVSVAADCWLLQ